MPVIIIITIAILLILIELTWKSLEDLEKNQKIIFILVGLIITFIITLIIFNISKSAINYNSKDMIKSVQNILVSVFTALNGLVFIVPVARIYMKIKNKDSNISKIKINIIVMIILFILVIIFETNYFENIQDGIIKIYNSKIK